MQTWRDVIGDERRKNYFHAILSYIEAEKAKGKIIYPPTNEIFHAFRSTEFYQVKVVILGQDPYHGAGQAHGLAFSVKKGIVPPPSLVNIYKELANDIPNFTIPKHGYLQKWAEQGVFLLNSALSVEKGQANSHANIGWEKFTDVVIDKLNQNRDNLVFMLWGSHAQKKGKLIDRKRHCVLAAPHPSPLSAHRGFFGCCHFSLANQYLQQHNQSPIDWNLPV